MQNLEHLGIVAGLVDELEIVEPINQHLGEDPREQVSPGVAVKAMILNGGVSPNPQLMCELLLSFVACANFDPADYARPIAKLYATQPIAGSNCRVSR